MTENILEVKNLSVEKNGHKILEDISFEAKKGETLAVIGPNGAGKTTLFRALLGLIPYTGSVKWAKDTKAGFVPQKLYIEPDLPLTTYEFMQLKEPDRKNIISALYTVGLNDKNNYTDSFEKHILESRLGNLSGGELQRVLIAWSLLGSPNVLLFDEPTSGVDMVGEETVYSMLHHLKDERNMTIFIISHEIHVIHKFTDQVLCLNKESVCFGPPAQSLTKRTIEKLFGEEVNYFEHGKHPHNF